MALRMTDGVSFSFDSVSTRTVLLDDFFHSRQEGRKWCWAACVQMIADYYDWPERSRRNIPQCKMANFLFGLSHCCVRYSAAGRWRPPSECDKGCPGEKVADLLRRYGVRSRYTRVPTVSQVTAELRAGRPVLAILMWGEEAGYHVAIITGIFYQYGDFSEDYPMLRVSDPGDARSRDVDWEHFVKAYGKGKWLGAWQKIEG